jgi:energy-coupling factor transporter transmembrane protein EcfT
LSYKECQNYWCLVERTTSKKIQYQARHKHESSKPLIEKNTPYCLADLATFFSVAAFFEGDFVLASVALAFTGLLAAFLVIVFFVAAFLVVVLALAVVVFWRYRERERVKR